MRISETTETLIDIILTNNPSNMIKTEAIPTSIGDHDMAGCLRKLNNASCKSRKITCRDYRSYCPETMNRELETVDWSALYISRNVKQAWSQLKNILLTIFEHHAPLIQKKTRIFPADRKRAKIVPIHKSGSRSSLDNYRPISVLPVLSKVIENTVHRQVMEFLEQNKLLSAFQFRFRPKLSTELAATLLLDDIRKNVDEGKLVGAAFIDLSKAFDTIIYATPMRISRKRA
eukprot:gene10408-19109_t